MAMESGMKFAKKPPAVKEAKEAEKRLEKDAVPTRVDVRTREHDARRMNRDIVEAIIKIIEGQVAVKTALRRELMA